MKQEDLILCLVAGLTSDNIAEVKQTTKAEQYHFGKAVCERQSFAKMISAQAVEKVFCCLK
ncbi:hypothetical protein [Virgibacillus chiguensis]|uniref:hypothetical protein n=1 Tax=Virgibacillus chiguensis TaxID=411959 RepID=UPI001FCDAE51|nr:hypothetical protein [Virgibacillus chiguensis]